MLYLKHNPYLIRTYDFETSDRFAYYKFLDVLKIFNLFPLEEYNEGIECCQIRFVSTKEERLQIEYIFRKLLNLDSLYLMDLDSYQNRAKVYREERYAIY